MNQLWILNLRADGWDDAEIFYFTSEHTARAVSTRVVARYTQVHGELYANIYPIFVNSDDIDVTATADDIVEDWL